MGERCDGEWRCSACGHGRKLYGCAVAVVYGQLEPRGEVTEDCVTQDDLCESSIECIVHQTTAPLERWIGGAWCLFAECEQCKGRGEKPYITAYGRRDHSFCHDCNGRGGHWLPAREVVNV